MKLRMIRQSQDIPSKAMAALLGVSPAQLQKYETGKNHITVSRLLQFCGILGANLADILDAIQAKKSIENLVFYLPRK